MVSGIVIALFVLSGAILRSIISGMWMQTISYLVGIFFIVSLAETLGTVTGSSRMFEALSMI